MNNWQRIFAYLTGAIVLGLLFIIISHNFIEYAARESTAGYLFLVGFGLVYLNINFGMSRRFVIKALTLNWIGYLMAIFTIAPTIFWVYTKETGLNEARFLFVLVISFSAFLGSYFGIRRGLVKREKYIRQLREEGQELPNSLKRPHDDLSKN